MSCVTTRNEIDVISAGSVYSMIGALKYIVAFCGLAIGLYCPLDGVSNLKYNLLHFLTTNLRRRH